MKNLFTQKGATAAFGILLLLGITTCANSTSDPERYPLELNLLAKYVDFPVLQDEEFSYKFYDTKDSLVYEAKLKFGETPEFKLVKLLNESDYLAEVNGHKVHRLKEKTKTI